MKKFLFLFVVLTTLALLTSAETYRNTTSDMYRQSYATTMSRAPSVSTADVRAEQYRSFYEVCDADHNCVNQTMSGQTGRQEGKSLSDTKHEGAAKMLWTAPTWL